MERTLEEALALCKWLQEKAKELEEEALKINHLIDVIQAETTRIHAGTVEIEGQLEKSRKQAKDSFNIVLKTHPIAI